MATTIVDGILTITITEDIVLNGQSINSSNKIDIAAINEVDKRIVTIPVASEVNILAFAATVAAGTFIPANVKYIRITNKDSANPVRCRAIKSGADTVDLQIDPLKSIMLGNTSIQAFIAGGAFTAFVNMTGINLQAVTANCDVEYFIAAI